MSHAHLQQRTWPYPRWIAHRGAGKLAPENTLAAFRLGAHYGYRMAECDVKLSADGVPFLLHDDDLARTTNAATAKTYIKADLSIKVTCRPRRAVDTDLKWEQFYRPFESSFCAYAIWRISGRAIRLGRGAFGRGGNV